MKKTHRDRFFGWVDVWRREGVQIDWLRTVIAIIYEILLASMYRESREATRASMFNFALQMSAARRARSPEYRCCPRRTGPIRRVRNRVT
jgi:hypothetical protein